MIQEELNLWTTRNRGLFFRELYLELSLSSIGGLMLNLKWSLNQEMNRLK